MDWLIDGMTQAGPLEWHTGAGWLVLAGRADWRTGETGDLDAAGLAWAKPNRPTAVLLTAGASAADGEQLLDYYGDLGGSEGYVVPVFDVTGAQDLENCLLLAQAGLIYIADGPDVMRLIRALRNSPALDALLQTFEEGDCIVAVGAGAAALSAWISATDNPQGLPGLELLCNMLVEPAFSGSASAGELRKLLREHSDCLGIGIPGGVALALGPSGEVKTVGEGQITVVLNHAGEEV